MLKTIFTKGEFSMKRKIVTAILATVLSTSLCACGISQEDYNKVVSEKEAVEKELATTKDSLAQSQEDYDTAIAAFDSIQTEYEAYKEKMKPYEEMEAAEAEARKAEAEAAAKAQQAQDDATEAVASVWDSDNGALADGATRDLYEDAVKKVNAVTDESVKKSLKKSLKSADKALSAIEKEEADKKAKEEAIASANKEEQNALATALSYLDYSGFSYKGLVKQLEYEGYSNEAATFAVDNCGADWNEQAAKVAESYINYSSFSRSGLIDQLQYEGFTKDQAEYGATAVGY